MSLLIGILAVSLTIIILWLPTIWSICKKSTCLPCIYNNKILYGTILWIIIMIGPSGLLIGSILLDASNKTNISPTNKDISNEATSNFICADITSQYYNSRCDTILLNKFKDKAKTILLNNIFALLFGILGLILYLLQKIYTLCCNNKCCKSEENRDELEFNVSHNDDNDNENDDDSSSESNNNNNKRNWDEIAVKILCILLFLGRNGFICYNIYKIFKFYINWISNSNKLLNKGIIYNNNNIYGYNILKNNIILYLSLTIIAYQLDIISFFIKYIYIYIQIKRGPTKWSFERDNNDNEYIGEQSNNIQMSKNRRKIKNISSMENSISDANNNSSNNNDGNSDSDAGKVIIPTNNNGNNKEDSPSI